VISEDRLIDRIVGHEGAHPSRSMLRRGVGDDAAVLAPRPNTEWVISCDAFLEGVHFLADTHVADSIGYKALARATSDLAAMGARPRFFLLTLALPIDRVGKWLDDFLSGMRRAARHLGMTLIGGDTTRNPTVFISMTVIGDIAPGRAVARSGARPGDLIYVTGVLGAAQLGLLLLKNRLRKPIDRHLRSLLRAHLYPPIQVQWGAWLASHRLASAMIDVSDGLSTDLNRLCEASGVGAQIWADHIPCAKMPHRLHGKAVGVPGLSPLELALNGGEDYELLFTVSPRNLRRLRRARRFSELAQIGEVRGGRQLTLVEKNGTVRPLVAGGWDPFGSK
jgi:thiamine-monophosphate kinase